MADAILFWVFFAAILGGLAAPPAYRAKSWKHFFWAALLSFLGIFVPLFVFGVSAFLLPDWKGACQLGWLDCFHLGKLALTPLVLWASAAFYTRQILKSESQSARWVDLGLVLGAIVSLGCSIYGIALHGLMDELSWFLIVPFYTTLWYFRLCYRIVLAKRDLPYIEALLVSLPFWAASFYWSKQRYLSLPDTAPDCFVVTAALRGHPGIVGPFSEVERRGKIRVSNQQLRTFWQFEDFWQGQYPGSHRLFRRIYNGLGPRVARRIEAQWVADGVYLLLKPVEVLAKFILVRGGRIP